MSLSNAFYIFFAFFYKYCSILLIIRFLLRFIPAFLCFLGCLFFVLCVCYSLFLLKIIGLYDIIQNMINLQDIWQDTLSELLKEPSINAVAYSIWIEKLSPVCIKDDVLILLAPSLNSAETVRKSFSSTINKCLSKVKPTLKNTEIITREELSFFIEAGDFVHNQELVVSSSSKKRSASPFISRYTFDNFVVGESNKLAFYAAKSVAEKPGSSDGCLNLNPLFIYGGVGLGKTHLLHSIGNYISKHFPSLKIVYMPTESLVNEYFAALEKTSSDKNAYRNFIDKYQNVDVLMFDDVQFLKKKIGLQDAIFHIFNTLYQSGKQIILSSDRPPKEIETIEDRLCSRFEGGLLADIGMPNLDMRIAIICKKMMLEKVAVSDDVVYFLAETIDTNIRELEGALLKVILYAQLINKPHPDVETAKEALRVSAPVKKEDIDSSDIINATCTYYRISKADLLSKKKTKDISDARMVAIYLVCDLLSIPLVNIGQIFGGRDHTTIIHARDKIMNQLKENKKLELEINDIRSMLNV